MPLVLQIVLQLYYSGAQLITKYDFLFIIGLEFLYLLQMLSIIYWPVLRFFQPSFELFNLSFESRIFFIIIKLLAQILFVLVYARPLLVVILNELFNLFHLNRLLTQHLLSQLRDQSLMLCF